MDGDDGGVIYDDDIKAQMQNAIDDLLRLNGCEDGPASHHLATVGAGAAAAAASGVVDVAPSASPGYDAVMSGYGPPLKNGEQFCNTGDMQVDLALNEAVNSIL